MQSKARYTAPWKQQSRTSEKGRGCKVIEGTPEDVALTEDERKRRLYNRGW